MEPGEDAYFIPAVLNELTGQLRATLRQASESKLIVTRERHKLGERKEPFLEESAFEQFLKVLVGRGQSRQVGLFIEWTIVWVA